MTLFGQSNGERNPVSELFPCVYKEKHKVEGVSRDTRVEEAFLQKYARVMPRTTLRYAIERFCQNKRMMYLKSDT